MNKVKQKLKSWFVPGEVNDHRPHILRNKTVLLLATFIICLKLAILVFLFFFPNTAYFSAITTSRLVELTNQTREATGLSSLMTNEKLNQSAYLKAQDILEKNYFAHTSPLGLSPWYWFKQAQYSYHYAGENLAIDFIDAESLHNAWMTSAAHKANILSGQYKEIGIAVLTGEIDGRTATIAVQHFGTQFARTADLSTEVPTDVETKVEKPKPTVLEVAIPEIASVRQTDDEPILTAEEEKIDKEIAAVIQEKIHEFEVFAQTIQDNKPPRVLGVLIEKSGEIGRQVTIYTVLFLVLALLLNIIIKFEVQHKALIVNTFLIVLLIVLLLVVGDKSILNINLNII